MAKANFPLVYGRWSVHTNDSTHVINGGIPMVPSNKSSFLGPFTYSEGTLAPIRGWSGFLILNDVHTSHKGDETCSEAELKASFLNPFPARYHL